MWFPMHPQGTRVRIRRGARPLDPSLVGRTGFVVGTNLRRQRHYGVILDGEEVPRAFREDELEKEAAEVEAAGSPPAEGEGEEG